MDSPNPVAADKKENGILQMEILEKLKHETGGAVPDPQFLAEQLANYQKLHRSAGIADSPIAAHAAELFKREAILSTLRPKLDYFNLAALQEQQYLASSQGRMSAPSPPRRVDSPSGSEDGGSISPNHAPPSAGGQWTYEEQFKQVCCSQVLYL